MALLCFFFPYKGRKQAVSVGTTVQVLDLFEMELEFWRMSVGNLGKTEDK